MYLTGKEDLRVQKTIESINQSFDDMISEMDYHQITVKELCERARINKKTFYRYYPCIDNLLAEKQSAVIQECLKMISSYNLPEELDQLLRAQFFFFHNQKGLYEKIIYCRGEDSVIDQNQFRQILKEKYWDDALKTTNTFPESHEMMLRFIQTNVISFYRDWVQSGKKIPIEEMIQTASTLICSGVKGLFNA